MHYLKKREMFTIHKPFFEKIKKRITRQLLHYIEFDQI